MYDSNLELSFFLVRRVFTLYVPYIYKKKFVKLFTSLLRRTINTYIQMNFNILSLSLMNNLFYLCLIENVFCSKEFILQKTSI